MYFAKAFSDFFVQICFGNWLTRTLMMVTVYVSLLFICLFVYVLSSCSWRSHASVVDCFICFVRTEYKIFIVYEWHRNLPYVFSFPKATLSVTQWHCLWSYLQLPVSVRMGVIFGACCDHAAPVCVEIKILRAWHICELCLLCFRSLCT